MDKTGPETKQYSIDELDHYRFDCGLKPEHRESIRTEKEERRTQKERRESKRYRAQEGTFAALHNYNSYLGQIENISMKGVTFKYINGSEKIDPQQRLRILLTGKKQFVENLPCLAIHDCEAKDPIAYSMVKMRQVHFAFVNLTKKQRLHLNHFIVQHTEENT